MTIVWILEMAGTTSSGASNAISQIEMSLKRKSNDVGWEYGELVDTLNVDKMKCKLCGKVLAGGVNRLKYHIGHVKGNVVPCSKSSDEDKEKCKKAIDDAKMKRMRRIAN